MFLPSYEDDDEAKLSVGIYAGGLFYFFTDLDLERLRSLPLANMFLSNLFIVLVKLFEALLLELLTMPEGLEFCCRKGETFVLLALRSFEDYVSES